MYSRKVFANFANFCHGLQKTFQCHALYIAVKVIKETLSTVSLPHSLEIERLLQTITKPNDKIQLWTFSQYRVMMKLCAFRFGRKHKLYKPGTMFVSFADVFHENFCRRLQDFHFITFRKQ